MTNTELAEKINGYLKGSKAKAKKYEDLVAANITILEENEDVYVEVKDGVLTVAPYHYNDLQVNITGSAESIDKLFSGEIAFAKAVEDGIVKVDGDAAKFYALEPLVPSKKAEKKPAAKAATKPAAKSAAKPAAAKAEPKVEKKTAAAPAKAPAAEKAPAAAKATSAKKNDK